MSVIYSSLTSIINKISDAIHESFLFTLIFTILGFIENQWVNSYFKRFYPGENFLNFLNRNVVLKEYLFHPLIVLLVFALFLILSLNSPSTSLAITLAIAFVSFFIGSTVLPKYFLNRNLEKIIYFDRKDFYSIGFCLLLVSIIFFFISVASVGGIPLLKPSIRYLLKPIFPMPVFLIIPVIIIGFYGNIVSLWEVVLGALLGISAIIGIGYFRSLGEMTITSATSPIYTLQSRADFTLHVLNLLDFIGGNFGVTHGHMLVSSIPGSDLGPRMMVGKLIAWRTEVTVTPTLIGQMVVDFGKFGVLVGMCLLGFILGIGFKLMQKTKDFAYIGIYSIILTYTILGVETGILDIQVLIYFILAIFIYFTCIKRSISD